MAEPAETVKDASGARSLAQDLISAKNDGTGDYAALAILEKLDGFRVEQTLELVEVVTCNCWEVPNEYTVFDKDGKVKLFIAREKTGCCNRQCCGEHRPFKINIYDHTGKDDKKVMTINRGYHCPCPYFLPIPFCGNKISVHYMVDDQGNPIDSTSSQTLMSKVALPLCGGFCCPKFNISDRSNRTLASIQGPVCCVTDCCGADFDVTDREGGKVGEIKKLGVSSLRGAAKEFISDADNYLVTFPDNLAPEIKMAMLAALLQIDFMFFEDPRSPREGRCCDIWCCGCPCACCPRWATCLCCYESKEAREKAKKKKQQGKGAPDVETMER